MDRLRASLKRLLVLLNGTAVEASTKSASSRSDVRARLASSLLSYSVQ